MTELSKDPTHVEPLSDQALIRTTFGGSCRFWQQEYDGYYSTIDGAAPYMYEKLDALLALNGTRIYMPQDVEEGEEG